MFLFANSKKPCRHNPTADLVEEGEPQLDVDLCDDVGVKVKEHRGAARTIAIKQYTIYPGLPEPLL